MNRIQKAATAAIALTITLVGATLVTAPLALGHSYFVASHRQSWDRQVIACTTCAPLRRGAVGAVVTY